MYVRESELDGAIKNPAGLDDDGVLRKINKTPQVNKEIIILDPETADLQEWLKSDEQVAKGLEILKNFESFTDKLNPKKEEEDKLAA